VRVQSRQKRFFVLDPEQHRVSGSGGCNRLTGSYELNGDPLKFGRMAGTMMMCSQGMDTEQAFLKSLGPVSKWKITGGVSNCSIQTEKCWLALKHA
jgi:heat shock protein HslJ